MYNIYEMLEFPGEANINKQIDKSKFLNDKVSQTLKSIFDSVVIKVKIKFILTDINTDIKKKGRNASQNEVIVLQVSINNSCSVYDVATAISRSIIYPMILILKHEDKIKIGVYKNRDNLIYSENNCSSDFFFTGWYNISQKNVKFEKICSLLNYNNLNHDNFEKFYSSFYNIIVQHRSRYIDKNIAVKFFRENGIYTRKDIEEKILKNCEHVRVNAFVHTKKDIYKTSRLDKYANADNDNYKVMICLDDLYQFAIKHGEKNAHTYDDFVLDLNEYKSYSSFVSHRKSSCLFNNNGLCEQTGCVCDEPLYCNWYEGDDCD